MELRFLAIRRPTTSSSCHSVISHPLPRALHPPFLSSTAHSFVCTWLQKQKKKKECFTSATSTCQSFLYIYKKILWYSMPHLYICCTLTLTTQMHGPQIWWNLSDKHTDKFEFISTFLAAVDAFVKEEQLLLRDEDALLIKMNSCIYSQFINTVFNDDHISWQCQN